MSLNRCFSNMLMLNTINHQGSAHQGASLMVQMVKNLPAMPETQVRSLGQEDHLEKRMVTHSSDLAWRIPWTEEPGRLYSSWGCKESDMIEQLNAYKTTKTYHHTLEYSIEKTLGNKCWQRCGEKEPLYTVSGNEN